MPVDVGLPDNGLADLERELARWRRQAQVNRVFAEQVLTATRKLAEMNVDQGMEVESLRAQAGLAATVEAEFAIAGETIARLREEKSHLMVALDRAENEVKGWREEVRRLRLHIIQARSSLVTYLTPTSREGLSAREQHIIDRTRSVVEELLDA